MPRGVYAHKVIPPEDRFWAKVQKGGPDECWLWKNAGDDYGRFMADERSIVYAHRYSFWLAYGHWPDGDCRHSCHTPACVNPRHLLSGTRKQNMQDSVEAGRTRTGERNPVAKLTWSAVRRAREQYAAGASCRSLARAHGVSEATMRACLNGETWKIESGER